MVMSTSQAPPAPSSRTGWSANPSIRLSIWSEGPEAARSGPHACAVLTSAFGMSPRTAVWRQWAPSRRAGFARVGEPAWRSLAGCGPAASGQETGKADALIGSSTRVSCGCICGRLQNGAPMPVKERGADPSDSRGKLRSHPPAGRAVADSASRTAGWRRRVLFAGTHESPEVKRPSCEQSGRNSALAVSRSEHSASQNRRHDRHCRSEAQGDGPRGSPLARRCPRHRRGWRERSATRREMLEQGASCGPRFLRDPPYSELSGTGRELCDLRTGETRSAGTADTDPPRDRVIAHLVGSPPLNSAVLVGVELVRPRHGLAALRDVIRPVGDRLRRIRVDRAPPKCRQ